MATKTKVDPHWYELVRLEPRLRSLFDEARRVKDDRRTSSFCANAVWFGWEAGLHAGFKWRMSKLVGYDARPHAILGTSRAYDVAYETIYNALPDCRNCLCCAIWS